MINIISKENYIKFDIKLIFISLNLYLMINDQFDFLFKLVLTGDSSVGKTNILSRFVNNNFDANQKTTIGVEFCTKNIIIDNNQPRESLAELAQIIVDDIEWLTNQSTEGYGVVCKNNHWLYAYHNSSHTV